MAKKLYNLIFTAMVLLLTIAIGAWLAVELFPVFHFAWPIIVIMITWAIMLIGETVLVLVALADYKDEKWKTEQLKKAKETKGWQVYTDTWKEVEATCKDCSAWSGTDCMRNPYTDDCLKEKGEKEE